MAKVELQAQIDAVNLVLTTGEVQEEALAEALKTLRLIDSHLAYFQAAFKFIIKYPEYDRVWEVFPGAEFDLARDLPVMRHDLQPEVATHDEGEGP